MVQFEAIHRALQSKSRPGDTMYGFDMLDASVHFLLGSVRCQVAALTGVKSDVRHAGSQSDLFELKLLGGRRNCIRSISTRQ